MKPSNVLLDQQGGREHVYLADFGLTQSVSDSGPSDGNLMGSVDYVAPEQIRGDQVDSRADVYALGCLLFETLTGTLPFSGASDVAVVYAHLEEEPPRASERRPALDPAIDGSWPARWRRTRQGGSRRAPSSSTRREPRSASYGASRPPCGVSRSRPAATAAPRRGSCDRHRPRDSRRRPRHAATGGSLVRIDPANDRVTDTYAVSAHPRSVTTARPRVWLGDFRDGSLWRLDPARGDLQRFTTTGEPRDLTGLASFVYVAGDGDTIFDGTVTRYNAVTGAREAGVQLTACSVAAGDGVLWAAGCPYIDRLSTGPGPLRRSW